VAAGIGEFLTVLGLKELTGLHGTADTYLETIQKAMRHNEIEDGKNVIILSATNLSPNYFVQGFVKLSSF